MVSETAAENSELNMDVVCRFSGHLAHELNNLLTPIIACGQMLRDGMQKSDPLYFCADQVAEAGERCLALSRKLQIIGSRRASGHIMDITSLVHEGIRQVVFPAERQIRIVEVPVEAAIADRLHIKADMDQFMFLVNEMLANAAAAMPQGGCISVCITHRAPVQPPASSAPGTEWVCLSIRDEGGGMTPDVLAHMYEPYFSTHGKEKDKGLGLTLVYGIVRRGGGTIECDSSPGAGTDFRLYFPRCPPADIT